MEMIDPFLWQLFIVPLIVIGSGVLVSALTRKIFAAPIITLVLNALYEVWYIKYYLQASDIHLTSWNIIFPAISLVLSFVIVNILMERNK